MTSGYLDYEWFLKKDLSGYAGKWVAIIDRNVVASDKDPGKVLEEAKKLHPNKKPLLTKVRATLSIF